MVGVRMGADDHADVAARRLPQAFDVFRLVRAGVDGDVTRVRVAHEVTVGAGASHRARVRGGQADHVFQEAHRGVGAPIQVMHYLAVGADKF